MTITADANLAVRAVLEDVTATREVLRFVNRCSEELKGILGDVPEAVDGLVILGAVWYAGRMEPRQLIVKERP